jgi:bcr-type benzoyl-CoA reductase subunit C
MIDTFRELTKDPAAVAIRWKAEGKKVAGCRCLYVPEEIIWAAGLLPYPLLGTPEPVSLADSYFQSCTCEFVRNLFDQALNGRLAFLDCVALANTCDVIRHFLDMWNAYIRSAPAFMINNPQKLGSQANREYYLEELKRFRKKVEEVSGNKITDQKLQEAIDLYNETRALLKEMYGLRKQDPTPLSGQEAFEIARAVSILPKDQANPLLRRLLEELRAGKTAKAEDGDRTRILVTGSLIDHPALIRIVEEQGGIVVADDLCTTSRTFQHLVEPDPDPLEALYRYFNKLPLCACLHPEEARLAHLLELVEEFEVTAVINFNLKYCHPSLYEAPNLQKELAARDIPSITLEVGHDLSGHGQLATRIQAFLEMVAL